MRRIAPLIAIDDVRQAGLGRRVEQRPATRQTFESVKGVVTAVYPPDHPDNRLGQTLVDVQPLADLPQLFRVPLGAAHAHRDTDPAAPASARRQPFAARARNTIEGSVRDVRPGTYVWIQFAHGGLYDPVAVVAMQPRQTDARPGAAAEFVDTVTQAGDVEWTALSPLQAGRQEYPRALEVYNGVRVLVDNRGNRIVQTSCDRVPVWPGHNGIPKSPAPQGSYLVSTRGAVVGHLVLVTGKHPRTGEASRGRQGRLVLEAEDGTIRDETRDAGKGSFIRRLRSTVGRLWESTKGSDDGRCYREAADGSYEALGDGVAELYGDREAVVQATEVYLGGPSAGGNAVTHAELADAVGQILQLIDTHTHTGVQTGAGTSGTPIVPLSPLWNGLSETFKAQNVHLDTANSPQARRQDDPDGA